MCSQLHLMERSTLYACLSNYLLCVSLNVCANVNAHNRQKNNKIIEQSWILNLKLCIQMRSKFQFVFFLFRPKQTICSAYDDYYYTFFLAYYYRRLPIDPNCVRKLKMNFINAVVKSSQFGQSYFRHLSAICWWNRQLDCRLSTIRQSVLIFSGHTLNGRILNRAQFRMHDKYSISYRCSLNWILNCSVEYGARHMECGF